MNGVQPFVYIWTCGCVFSQAGLKAVSKSPPAQEADKAKEKGEEGSKQLDMCPQCGAKYDKSEDIVILNPASDDEEKMMLAMERRRAAEPVKTKGKKRKNGASAPEGEPPSKKKNAAASAAPSLNPSIAATSRAVANTLAEEEAKRKASMSSAVKSLYGPKDGTKKKDTFMTMGTFTRVSNLSIILSRSCTQYKCVLVCLVDFFHSCSIIWDFQVSCCISTIFPSVISFRPHADP